MRSATLLLFSLILVSGCVSNFVHSEARDVAVKLGLREEEVVALAKETSVRHKRSIAWIRTSGKPDGSFEVGLSDSPKSPQGIFVVFRKINGRWQEDPTLQGPWII